MQQRKNVIIRRLYEKYWHLMHNAAHAILKDDKLAEDAVHSAFLKLIKNSFKIDEIDCHKTRTFMVIISRNAAINIYNKNHKQKVSNIEDSIFETIDPEPIPIEQIVSKDSIEKIINILDQMNSKYSDVMKLKYFNEYSNTEIAKILSIKEDNVRKRLSRGKNILLSKLAKEV